jgi:hypothetical protein
MFKTDYAEDIGSKIKINVFNGLEDTHLLHNNGKTMVSD